MHTHPRLVQITALALGIAGAMAFSQAHAAAFLLKENSVKAQGRSMAGAASAKGDASVVANNPAVMSTFDKNTFQADVTAIDLSFKFNGGGSAARPEEHTSELQSLMRISYAVFCLKKKNNQTEN